MRAGHAHWRCLLDIGTSYWQLAIQYYLNFARLRRGA
jgi:hypothetical protein